MKKNFFLILLLLISFNSIACLNGETKVLKNGVYVYEDYRGIVPRGHNFYRENYPKLIKELDSLYKTTKDLDYLSDKGYVLVIQKKYSEALEIYLNIEKLKPNQYSTASNLGTIYELLGENKKALFWINRAVQINPKSHNGSEWLHVKILQAKIGGAKYINSNFLINTNFGEEDEPKSKMSKSDREALMKSLYYQLNERVSFIKSEDKIISLLLFELGNLAYLEGKYDDAKDIYRKSEEYDFQNKLVKTRFDFIDWKIENRFYTKIDKLQTNNKYYRTNNRYLQTNNKYYQNLFITTLIIASTLIIVLLVILFRMKKKMKSAK